MTPAERAHVLIHAEYAEQRSAEWLALRETMLTASDCASAIGVNRYEAPEALLRKKVLKTSWAGNAATEHGTLLEPVARDLYDAMYSRKSHEIGLVQHPTYPFLGGSADGVTECGRLIEIKCPLTRKIDNKVPVYYIPQIQLLLEILDIEECDFIQYRPGVDGGDHTFNVVIVKRDHEWFPKYLPVMTAFWDKVLHGQKHGLCELIDDDPVDDYEVPTPLENPDM